MKHSLHTIYSISLFQKNYTCSEGIDREDVDSGDISIIQHEVEEEEQSSKSCSVNPTGLVSHTF